MKGELKSGATKVEEEADDDPRSFETGAVSAVSAVGMPIKLDSCAVAFSTAERTSAALKVGIDVAR